MSSTQILLTRSKEGNDVFLLVVVDVLVDVFCSYRNVVNVDLVIRLAAVEDGLDCFNSCLALTRCILQYGQCHVAVLDILQTLVGTVNAAYQNFTFVRADRDVRALQCLDCAQSHRRLQTSGSKPA